MLEWKMNMVGALIVMIIGLIFLLGMVQGLLIIGVGVGLMINTFSIHRLEKKIPQTP